MATSTNPPENMSVGELRDWLKGFEQKHQEHFHQNQVRRRRSPIKTGRRLSVRDRIFGLQQQSSQDETGPNNNDENLSQQENYRPRDTANKERSSAKQLVRNNNSQEENQNLSMVNQLPVIEDGKILKLELLPSTNNLSAPPLFKEHSSSPQGKATFVHGPTSGGLPDELCLALSAVTMASSSSSVEVEASESVATQESLQPFDLDSSELHQCQQQSAFAPEPGPEHRSVVHQERKSVPDAWSDFEPVDFDASAEDSSGSEKEKEDVFASNSWPAWNGDARQYLKKQAIAPFQGYWSDNECDEDDEDNDADDDNSVATGRKTEPQRSRYISARKSRRKGKFSDAAKLMGATGEDPPAPFSLVVAAMGSMAGDKARSRPRSLSEHFIVGTAKSVKTKVDDSRDNQSMHSAVLFQNKTLTAGALDVICNGKAGSPSQYGGNKLENFFDRGDQATISSWSIDSGKPSVAPNAVDPKLSKLFFSSATDDNMKRVVAREIRQPEDTARSSAAGDTREGVPSPDHTPSSLKEADVTTVTNSNSNGKATSDEISPTSSFTSVVERFGGGGGRQARKTRIQRQKDALEEQWANNRQIKHVKKTKWQVCRSSGAYKRKVVLDFEDK